MPSDSKGKFHLNTQRAHAADKAGAEPAPKAPAPEKPMAAMNDGAAQEGQHIGAHLMQQAAEHGGKHMHVTHDGEKFTSHHVGHDGMVEGPHDHENIEALKDHLGQFFSEEEHEGGGGGHSHEYDMANGDAKDIY